MSTPIVMAGYQGETSILTASLRVLAQGLETAGWDGPVDLVHDVTRTGERAAELFASLEGGSRHLGYMASGYLSHRVPELDVLDLPFAVADRAQALAALDGAAGQLLRQAVERATGLRVLAFWDNGFRHVSNALRPLRTPADCQGLVIRTLDSAAYREALAALGFQPMTTDVKDLVRVVESGAVQAQENPLTNLLTFALWRHHPHVSLTGHFFGVLLLVCPRAWHEALDAAQLDVLDAAVAAATGQQRALARDQDEAALTALRGHGVQVLLPQDLDLPAMRAATTHASQRLRASLPTELVQAYLTPTVH
jgi:TRAP-type C4-dicarboxylate transport system substrate-binding protein